jgi:Kef-type K+ transport system membrane component KefB
MVAVYILLVGAIVVFAMILRSGMKEIGIPSMIGFFVLGFLVRFMDNQWNLISEQGFQIFDFLAELGVIVLLFRVGLESKVTKLIRWLPTASKIWIGGVFFSGLLGFLASYYLLGWELVQSLFVSVAMTATSVGVTVSIWKEANLLYTHHGEILLDVAELDDISGVILMALLFAVAPVLKSGNIVAALPMLPEILGLFILKLIAFIAFCIFFSRYLEAHITEFLERIQVGNGTLLVILGIGMVVSAAAEMLGFSVAIGAFFAGLIFSRDPDSVKFDGSFEPLYDLFMPFFFVGIGLKINPEVITGSLVPVVILILAAFAGKLIGHGSIAYFVTGSSGALILGTSMIPRAEIALIIMQKGLSLGDWAVTPQIFANMVIVSAVTSLTIPLILRPMLNRKSQQLT